MCDIFSYGWVGEEICLRMLIESWLRDPVSWVRGYKGKIRVLGLCGWLLCQPLEIGLLHFPHISHTFTAHSSSSPPFSVVCQLSLSLKMILFILHCDCRCRPSHWLYGLPHCFVFFGCFSLHQFYTFASTTLPTAFCFRPFCACIRVRSYTQSL